MSTANKAPDGEQVVQYFDLETQKYTDDKAHADRLHKAGHRIRVSQRGKDLLEWIPGSYSYYDLTGGRPRLVKSQYEKYA